MNTRAYPIAPEVRGLIEGTVREYMDDNAIEAIAVAPGEDHDGDPVIFVDVYYALRADPIDPQVTATLSSELQTRLASAGEARFAHIRHRFHERQTVKSGRRARA